MEPPRDHKLLDQLRDLDAQAAKESLARFGRQPPSQSQLISFCQTKGQELSAAISCDNRFLALAAVNQPSWPGILYKAFGPRNDGGARLRLEQILLIKDCASAVESDPNGENNGKQLVINAIDASMKRASIAIQADILEDELDVQRVIKAKSILDQAIDGDTYSYSDAVSDAKKVERILLEPGVPRVVNLFYNEKQDKANTETLISQLKNATLWLVEALRAAGHSSPCKNAAKKLLGMRLFSTHLGPSQQLPCLQKEMRSWLEVVSRPMKEYYDSNVEVRSLANLELPKHASLSGTRRQDVDGLVPSLNVPLDNEELKNPEIEAAFWNNRIPGHEGAERVMIHVYRILAKLLAPHFETLGQEIVQAAGEFSQEKDAPIFKNPGCKGVPRMLNKCKAPDDHRYLKRPRPAANIDILRAAISVPSPSALRAATHYLASHAHVNGVSRVKNGLALTDEDAAKQFHYRAVLINFPYSPEGVTYSSLLAEPHAASVLHKYRRCPDTDTQPWSRWNSDVSRAIDHLKSLGENQVSMISEIQFMLHKYLMGRKQSHLPYKVVRADNQMALWHDFRKDEKRMGETYELDLAARLALFQRGEGGIRAGIVGYAAGEGDVDILSCGLEAGISANETAPGNGNVTPLFLACQNDHMDCVLALLKAGADPRMARDDGMNPLQVAAYNGHEECVLALVLHQQTVGKTEEDVPPHEKALKYAQAQGHKDIVELLASA